MKSSREANRPALGAAPGFEIWFLVVFDLERRQAYWLRYTTLRPAPERREAARAVVWAAAFDAAAPPLACKSIQPIEAFADRGGRDGFAVAIGDSELGHGHCRGAAGEIEWDLRFEPRERETLRFPGWLSRLPLPTRGHHAHAPTRFAGEVRVRGERRALTGAPGLQVHLFGRRRVEELDWIYCPAGELEVTRVRPRRHGPALCSIHWSRGGDDAPPPLRRLLGSRARRLGPGLLEARGGESGQLVRVRAFAAAPDFVGYRYRDPGGGDRWVAQSDVATTFAERFERPRRLGRWRRRSVTGADGLRGRARASREMALDLGGALGAAASLGGDLERGDFVLTGTPGGVALAASPWKRRLADRLLDRFGKLAAVIDQYARGDRFLRPGDRVSFAAGALGEVAIELAA